MSEIKRVTTPLTEEAIKDLHAGDRVLLSGVIYTARDKAHKRLCDTLAAGKPLPVDLQNQLKPLAEDIANARKYYNAVVKQFNNKCEMFPSNILANMFHFERKPMFEVDAEEERQNVKVEF